MGPEAHNLFAKSVRSLQLLALLALVPTFILGAAAPADDFYLMRLQAGKAEAAAGRPYEAIDDLKIASFGFLDQPALLIEGLSRLALAQAAAGRNDDAAATLRRLVEIERRYSRWAQADLEPGTRAAAAALVAKTVGADAAKLLEMPKVPPPAAVIGPPSPPASAAILVESKALVTQGRYVENLRRLVMAVAASPGDRDLRKALLEGAVLTKDWGTAVSQLEPLRPFRGGEEPWMFYGAVALSETGKGPEARELAEKALPRLSQSPFVDYYARKIVETAPKR